MGASKTRIPGESIRDATSQTPSCMGFGMEKWNLSKLHSFTSLLQLITILELPAKLIIKKDTLLLQIKYLLSDVVQMSAWRINIIFSSLIFHLNITSNIDLLYRIYTFITRKTSKIAPSKYIYTIINNWNHLCSCGEHAMWTCKELL
jgi:hypothetical protein